MLIQDFRALALRWAVQTTGKFFQSSPNNISPERVEAGENPGYDTDTGLNSSTRSGSTNLEMSNGNAASSSPCHSMIAVTHPTVTSSCRQQLSILYLFNDVLHHIKYHTNSTSIEALRSSSLQAQTLESSVSKGVDSHAWRKKGRTFHLHLEKAATQLKQPLPPRTQLLPKTQHRSPRSRRMLAHQARSVVKVGKNVTTPLRMNLRLPPTNMSRTTTIRSLLHLVGRSRDEFHE